MLMRVKHITVLGATGFLGSHLTAELRRRGFEVATPARDADLTSLDLGTVFYCIGLTGDAPRRPFDTVTAHVDKLSSVLRLCRFEQLVYLSSTRLYLGAPTGSENETLRLDPLDPGRLFNVSKAAGESLVAASKRPARIARLSNVYGPNWESDNFLPTIVAAACRDGAVTLGDAPESAKDYVHVRDAVDALIHIAVNGSRALYNVASGRNVTHGELATGLRRLTGCRIETGAQSRTIVFPTVDIARLRSEFPFAPRSVLADLPWLVDSCRAWLTRSAPLGDITC
jgi:nucleoside-diphosphate-sugar epimerase